MLLILRNMKILADINTRKKDIAIFLCFLAAAALLAWSAYAAWTHFRTTPPEVDRARYPVLGIDISSHNGMMNLQAAASDGVEFVWIKASEGETFRDKNFRLNHTKAGEAGMKRGAYHFFRFDKDGVTQAINMLEAIGNRKFEMGIAIDIESSGNPDTIPAEKVKERLSAMVDYLNLRGFSPTLYTNKKDYYQYLDDSFPGSRLWICSFSDDPISTTEWEFWQYSHSGSISGITGNVDLNVFGGSRKDWLDFLAGQQYQGNKSVN